MGLVILDLDNTISDDEWRRPFIDWTHPDPDIRYRAYHEQCVRDEPGNRVLFEHIAHEIIIFTSRPEPYRHLTEAWLQRHHIPAQALYMRANGQTGRSADIKREHLQSLLSLHRCTVQDIVCAYDDHMPVVNMYHGLGLHAECWAINVRHAGALSTSHWRRRTGRAWR